MKRPAGLILSAALILGAVTGRNLYESRKEYRLGLAALEAKRDANAIERWDRAIHWYFPGNPYVAKALERLWSLAQTLEKTDRKMALLAYDAARGGIYSIRSFYRPYASELRRINPRIAELRAREQLELHPDEDFNRVLEFHRAALEKDERPRFFRGFWAVAGFAGWIACTFGLIWKGFNREGRMSGRTALPWIAGIVACFGAWVLGLIRA